MDKYYNILYIFLFSLYNTKNKYYNIVLFLRYSTIDRYYNIVIFLPYSTMDKYYNTIGRYYNIVLLRSTIDKYYNIVLLSILSYCLFRLYSTIDNILIFPILFRCIYPSI